MSQSEEYIKRMKNALEGISAEDKGELVKETVAVFADSLPNIKHGLDRYRARAISPGGIINYDNDGDLKKLIGKIRQQEEDHQREIDDKYGTRTLSEHIIQCDEVLSRENAEEGRRFCYVVGGVYAETIPGFKDFLDFFFMGEPDPENDIPAIREKLKEYRDSIIRTANSKPTHSIVASAQSESNSSSRVSVEVSITNTIEAVDNMPSSLLSDTAKDELVALLQNLDREKSKGKERFAKAGKKVVDYLFDKAIEAIPVVLPYIIQAAQGLM